MISVENSGIARVKMESKRGYITLLIILLIYIIKGHVIGYIAGRYIDNYGELPSLREESAVYRFFIVVIAGPIIETFIYQYLIFKLYFYLFNKTSSNIVVSILVSSVLFSLSHNYNYFAIVSTFLSGLVLGYTYFFANNRYIPPFWCVTIIHSIHNLYGLLVNFI